MQSRFRSLWFVVLSFLIAACDVAPSGTAQASEDKPSSNRFGGIPVGDEDSSNTKGNRAIQHTVDVPDLEKRAETGDAEALFTLGEMYEYGDGVTKDIAKAVASYEKASAAKSNNPFIENKWQTKAQFRLGVMYHTGDGVPEDASKAIEWYQKAASQGGASAQYILGVMHENGDGIPKDTAKAVEWYQKAAAQEDADAQFRLGWMYGKGDGVPKDRTKAAGWFQKAAEQGHTEAQYMLGALYFNGDGVSKDYAKAAVWLQKAAAQGIADAQSKLGALYFNGYGVPEDTIKAVEWYQKAAAQGYAPAQFSLGLMYDNGHGVPKDSVLAYAWFNLAAGQGEKDLSEKASEGRAIAEHEISAEQIAEAQRLSSTWQPGQVLRREAEGGNATAAPDEPTPGGVLKKTGTGTLFVVSMRGQSITNAHVVKDCAELHIESRDGLATVTTTDAVNDLALIQIPGAVSAAAPIAEEPGKIRQGEDVVVFGYPLNTVLSSGGNLTPGVVSAMTGLGNNSNQIQITAPIQPGSSGSPVLNKKGEVVGVVSMKLSDVKMAAATGSVGQNVNFAVSGQTLKAFLDAHEVSYKDGAGYFSLEKTPVELADEARKWTLVVECWK